MALVADRMPVLGVVAVPAWERSYAGAHGRGAFRTDGGSPPRSIRVRYADPGRLALVGGGLSPVLRRLYLAGLRAAWERLGPSLMWCRIAEGAADLAPLATSTRERDTAAAHAVLVAAGGQVTRLDGRPLVYDKAGLRNPPALAIGDPEFDWARFVAPAARALPARAWTA